MPIINLGGVVTGEKYPPLPASKYLCTIKNIEERTTRTGHEMWRLTFEVAQGVHAGRLIFDNLVFYSAGFERIKNLCEALGVDITGELDLTPDFVLERHCNVEVFVKEYTDKQGRMRRGNEVAFSGFSATNGESQVISREEHGDDDDIPF